MLDRWDVLAAAGFLYAMEFVADKIPYVDSTWDVVSTAIRPTAGAVIGVLLAGDADSLEQAVLGVVGGGTALLSHLVKAGSRLAINSSPEPVTNVAASVAEDVTVLGVVWFAIEHPRAAAAIAARAAGRRAGGPLRCREAGPPGLAPLEAARARPRSRLNRWPRGPRLTSVSAWTLRPARADDWPTPPCGPR